MTSMEATLLKTLLRWARHVSRMEDHRLPKTVPYGILFSGYHNIGVQKRGTKTTWKSPWAIVTLTTTNGLLLLLTARPEDTPSIRLSPHSKTASGAILKTRSGKRKNGEVPASNSDRTLTYSLCRRICLSYIEFVGQKPALRRRGPQQS